MTPRLLLALALAAAVVVNVAVIVLAVQAPSFEDRWGPFEKPRRNEASCSWVQDCRAG
jgi:hypothetical protein